MGKHTVSVPEYVLASSRRKMTAGQWLTEFRVNEPGEGRTQVFRFTKPVSLTFDNGDGPRREKFSQSTALFRRLDEITRAGGVLVRVASTGWHLSARGLFALNQALHTAAVRKGGLNIVRHFLENQRGSRIPMRGDFDALLAYLEIRPVLTLTAAQKAAAIAQNTNAPEAQNGIYYVSSSIRHNAKGLGGKKPRRVRPTD